MAVIYILLPLAVLLASVALFAFIRAVRAGQFDDLPVEDRATVVQAMEILGQIFAGERANRPGLAAARNGDPHGE